MHFNNSTIAQARNVVFDMDNGGWHTAMMGLSASDGGSNVTISLLSSNGDLATILNDFFIPQLNPYEARVGFNTHGGQFQDHHHDIDNVSVTFSDALNPIPEPSTFYSFVVGLTVACIGVAISKRPEVNESIGNPAIHPAQKP